MNSGLPVAGVIGFPIAHSLSPRLHRFWLDELGIAGVYVPLEVAREDFSRVIDGLQGAGFAGVNVTVPHKQAAFAIANTVDEGARKTGAANLLVFQPDGTIHARNTDVEGLCASLSEEIGIKKITGQIAVTLGAGGAARAAVLALDHLGASEIRILNRDAARADRLAAELAPQVSAKLVSLAWSEWKAPATNATLLVNATSGGMAGAQPLDLSPDPLPAGAAVYDLVYNPLETELVKQARERGLAAANGLGTLMHQAVPAFESFFGARPQVTPALRAHLEAALRP
ncbi:MAG TPA: shikimate dehydrogenase [Rhizomicrobium sp.]|jgi:shikimate dehydrogenase|nr:shikimate dehydrogenase [Rhizomicrobium sp.]